MSHLHSLLVLLLLGLVPALAPAASDLIIQPADVTLTGPHASQRLLVLEREDGLVSGDRTPQTRFVTSNAAVATVDGDGVVRAVGDGEATITADHTGRQTVAKVLVRGTKDSFT